MKRSTDRILTSHVGSLARPDRQLDLLFAKELAARLPKPNQTANSLHPGVIATNLTRHMNPVVSGLFSTLGPLLPVVGAGPE